MRTSTNFVDKDGGVITGYDYDRQCWVKNYIIQPCGHPENMKPGCCFSGRFAGKDIRIVAIAYGYLRK